MNLQELIAASKSKKKEIYYIIEKACTPIDEVINTAIEVVADKKGRLPAYHRRALIVEIPLRLYNASSGYETLCFMDNTLQQKIDKTTATYLSQEYETKKSVASKEALARLECEEYIEQQNSVRWLKGILFNKIKYAYELLLSLKKLEETAVEVDGSNEAVSNKLPSLQYRSRQ